MKCIKVLILLALIILSSSFKTGYNWAQAWVIDKVISEGELPKSVYKKLKTPQLTLVLMTKKDIITTPSNGNTYLLCYLINHTDTTASIDCNDATIEGFSTEIFKENVWQNFQTPIFSGCDFGEWKQKLDSKQVLSIKIDHAENGPIKVPFRIKYRHNGSVIYSNVISVNIDNQNYERVGKRKI